MTKILGTGKDARTPHAARIFAPLDDLGRNISSGFSCYTVEWHGHCP
jgi:hypothetical protein